MSVTTNTRLKGTISFISLLSFYVELSVLGQTFRYGHFMFHCLSEKHGYIYKSGIMLVSIILYVLDILSKRDPPL